MNKHQKRCSTPMHFASCTQVGPGRREGGVGRLTKFLQNILLISIIHSYNCHDCHSSWSSLHLAIYWWPDLVGLLNVKNKSGLPNGNLHHMCWSQNGGFTPVSHSIFFGSTTGHDGFCWTWTDNSMVFEMVPLPTQGLTCWWFHGSMLLRPLKE